MSAPRCPKCGHQTYSKKFNSCTSDGCSLNHSVVRTVTLSSVSDLITIANVTVSRKINPTTPLNVTGKRGRPSKPDALTPAERQRNHRQKAKAS